ncbi:nitric oxide-associated protein 1-like [Sinocyclocheilus grahami]|uniref:Nitric oxide-associated protein 1-like n=1 Tax=Sinocyclocheilus grahami TaxID=75366 RepID=A0A672KSM9_SINGR|nr:PREDICTED: nitric oxide-associated protein 1-like [Sinocyclocheilus grahami]
MYKFLGASVLQFYTRTCLKHVSRPQLSREHEGVSLLRRSFVSSLISKDWATHVGRKQRCRSSRRLRCYSTRKGVREPASNQPRELYTLVEPQKQEQFVFPDFDEPVDYKDDEMPDHLLLHDLTSNADAKPVHEKHGNHMHLRGLEMQMKHLKGSAKSEVEENSLIEFHDEGFPLDRCTKSKKVKKQQKIYGTPDVDVAVSDTCCSGCGALMHCADPEIPGYLPSEKFRVLVEEDQLKKAICQRCFLINHHQKALNVTMSKEEYRAIVKIIKSEKALVLLIVDLLDLPDSIIPDLPELVGKNKHIVILGNKIDLLPGDAENYLQRIKRQLKAYCASMGISTSDNKDIHLISAKTGYGIENLITRLQSTWKYKGDVYLVGMANAGKSTLFNTLLESDYCKSRASDVIHKATISPWPGTTLNLLKFPIINPTPHRMFRRAERLKQASHLTEDDMNPEEMKRIIQFSKQGYLVGHIGRTFQANQTPKRKLVEFDPDSLSFGEDLGEDVKKDPSLDTSTDAELTYNEIKDAHWFYDTPGIMKEHDVLSLLNEQEVKLVVPTQAIMPRTFIMKPGMALFLGALARIDYLEGESSCWLTVVASNRIPVHITSLDKADEIYQKHAGNVLLAVPSGGEERMKTFPPLIAQDFELQGQGCNTAITDIKISSAGWVAVTAAEGDQLLLRTQAPEAAGLCLRTPPLLPHLVNLKGQRINKTPAYKTRKLQVLVDTGLSVKAAERLKVRNKK